MSMQIENGWKKIQIFFFIIIYKKVRKLRI